MNRINIICLGVRDMKKSIQFYRDGLGFQTDETDDQPAVIFFNTTGIILQRNVTKRSISFRDILSFSIGLLLYVLH